jgi:hypothetical protein
VFIEQGPFEGMHHYFGYSVFFSSLSIVYAFWVSQSNEAIMKYFILSLKFWQEFQVCYLNHLARYNYQLVSVQ